MAPRFVARQLSNPKGIGGFLIRQIMNRANARSNAFALDQLGVRLEDEVLEIGFGGGVSLPSLIKTGARITAVDRSADVVAAGARKFASTGTGRAKFLVAAVEALPFPNAHFNKVLTVNTVYFWTSLDEGFSEISRVLRPGGILALGFLPKESMDRMGMPDDIFTTRSAEELAAAASKAGFTTSELRRPTDTTKWATLLATR